MGLIKNRLKKTKPYGGKDENTMCYSGSLCLD